MKVRIPEIEYFLFGFSLQKGVLISTIITTLIWSTLLLLYLPYSHYISPARMSFSVSIIALDNITTTHNTKSQLDWSTIDRISIIGILFFLFLDCLLVSGVNRKYRPEPDLMMPWLSVYFLLIPAELVTTMVIIIFHPHPLTAVLLIPPLPYTYLWISVNSYRVQVVRTQEAVKKLVFQSRGQMNPSQKLFRKAFETEFKSTYDLASEVVEMFSDDKRSVSQPVLNMPGRARSPKHGGERKVGSHLDLTRRQRSPSNNSVLDLLQRELNNLHQGSYKPDVYETRSTWSKSLSNSPSVSPMKVSPAITPISMTPTMSSKQMVIGSSSPLSSPSLSVSSAGSRKRYYLDQSENPPQNNNFLTPSYVPKLTLKTSKDNIAKKEDELFPQSSILSNQCVHSTDVEARKGLE